MINKEEQQKFRRIVTVAGIVLFSLILTTILIVVLSTVKAKKNITPVASPVTMEHLEQMDPEPPQVITTELDIPK